MRTLPLFLLLAVTVSAQQTKIIPLFDGTQSLRLWSNQRDSQRLNREFESASHEYVGKFLNWKFVPKPGTTFNDMFLMVPIKRSFTSITFKVDNIGEPFLISSKITDGFNAEWCFGSKELIMGEQTVTVQWDEWQHASWSNIKEGPMVFPTKSIAVIAFGVKTGKLHEINIQGIDIQESVIDITDISGFQVPNTARAGYDLAINPFKVKLQQKIKPTAVTVSIQKNNTTVAYATADVESQFADQFDINCNPIPLQWILRKGAYDIEVIILGELENGMKNVTASKKLGTVDIIEHEPFHPETFAEVKNHNGTPTIFINGKPHNGMAYAAYRPNFEVFKDFTSVNVDLFTICATPTESGYNISPTAWVDENTYDYTHLDKRVEMVLAANPKAYIFPRLYVHAPRWWSIQNPDELVIAEKPDGTRYVFDHLGKPAPSWASKKWRQDTIKGLQKLIEYIESSPYANNFIGYHIASGTTEEWMMWGSNENEWVDYSPANTNYFREWLKNKYKNDENLKKAWNNNDVTIDTAEIPTYKERANANFGMMRNPENEMNVIDFYQYNSWLVADTIKVFTKAVKDATKRRKTVGIFYGYLLQLCGGHRQQNSGHNALADVLASPDIDFICSPTSYSFRQLGGKGTCHFMSLIDTIKLHGKLWFNENDVRTSLSPGKLGAWGKPENVDGDIIQQDKELACVLTNGVVQWWFDVGANRYDDPKLLDAIKNYTRVASIANTLDRSPITQAAFVIDETSLAYLKVAHRQGWHLTLGRLPQIHRAGCSFGHYLASDLDKIQDHKLIVLTNIFNPSDECRKQVEKLKSGNRVILFYNGSGTYTNNRIDIPNIKAFTGINVKLDEGVAKGPFTFNDTPVFCDTIQGQSFGSEHYIQEPALIPDDPEAIVVATYQDGRPAVAIKKFPSWTAVYCAEVELPPAFYANLAKLAGIHRFIDTPDVVWANKSMLAVSVDKPGKRTINLIKPAKVTELYSGRQIAETPAKTFEADFPENATLLFKLD